MASNNPFYTGTSSPSTAMPANGSTQRLALDNMIRRELKVGDPNDPAQIAQALLNRYKEDSRAIAIGQEAKGLPFLLSAQTPISTPKAPTSSDAEVQQAVDDVSRDFQELTTNAVLKDIKLELQGWESAIQSAITEGITTARFALDPRQRDKVFGIRRMLGDYARLARLVGALTPVLNINYRKLAQSLDEVSAILLVLMGEALANIGFSGGRYLLQVPYSELQIRRDAAINALRNLTGSAQEAYVDSSDWARGIGAYRKLFQTLEAQGQGDLRALLVETELVRVMDALIQRSGQGSVEGLRQLGVTAQIEAERFRRLVFVAQTDDGFTAPPLAAFLDALLLFAEAFDSSGGHRLLRIARPPILFYGLYGIGEIFNAEKRLVRLVVERGALAEKLDCFMQCGDFPEQPKVQIILDKILYDMDRAIDLYAVGKDDFGEAEQRASAYGDVIKALKTTFEKIINVNSRAIIDQIFSEMFNKIIPELKSLLQPLSRDNNSLWDSSSREKFDDDDANRNLRIKELCIHNDLENRWINLVKTMAPSCVQVEGIVQQLLVNAIANISGKEISSCPQPDVRIPPTQEESQQQLATHFKSKILTRKAENRGSNNQNKEE